jgi:hypothetical protein
MKDELLAILHSGISIKKIPHLVRKDKELSEWIINSTSHLTDVKFTERMYVCAYDAPNFCENGKKRKFKTLKLGYGYCARAELCKCLRDQSSISSILHYSLKSKQEKKEIVQKRKDTCLQKYNVSNVGQTETAISSRKEYYANDNNIKEMIEKVKDTKYKKYGDCFFNNSDKNKKTCQKRYGTDYYTQSNDYAIKRKNSVVHNNPEKEIMYDDTALAKLSKSMTPVEISQKLGYANSSNVLQKIRSLGCDYKKRNIYSLFELNVLETLKQLSENIHQSDRTILNGLELDIYLPDKKLAIECNGSYWHSELQGKDRKYHVGKTNMCAEQGIHLIHIWEHDWINTSELIKSRLKSKLGTNSKLHARKCDITEINFQTVNTFLNQNHIQGSCASSVNIGLYHQMELVAVMTFGKSRYDKNIEWELIRYCSKQNTNVVGGASKLFSHFKKNHNPTSLISYSDKSWNTGGLYFAIGFEYSHTTSPSYKYTQDYTNFENRVAYQKHKLKDKLDVFDPKLTEWENMKLNGYDRIWDCGTDVFVWRSDK